MKKPGLPRHYFKQLRYESANEAANPIFDFLNGRRFIAFDFRSFRTSYGEPLSWCKKRVAGLGRRSPVRDSQRTVFLHAKLDISALKDGSVANVGNGRVKNGDYNGHLGSGQLDLWGVCLLSRLHYRNGVPRRTVVLPTLSWPLVYSPIRTF
jgi:hypothetical protein